MTADQAGLEHEINLRRLLLFRIITATALLLPALYSQFLVGTQSSLVPLHASIAVIYGVSLLYVLAQRAGMLAIRLLSLQLTIELAIQMILSVRSGTSIAHSSGTDHWLDIAGATDIDL